MLYWLKVYGLIATIVFAPTGIIITSLFLWYEAKRYASAQHRIYKRLSSLLRQPQIFATPFVISRAFSRSQTRTHLFDHKVQ
jgi:hypothetical protein